MSHHNVPDPDKGMALRLQEVLVRALKKLEEPSFQRFIEKLSLWGVREEYDNIPTQKLTGKDLEHVASLIAEYYRDAYGAEVTLAVLEDIDEKKVREELQHDLREVDKSGHGFGTMMFTDRVNFIDNHRSDLITWITDDFILLFDLRDQGLLTQDQFKDVINKRTSREKIEDLCDIIKHWEDAGKYKAYTVFKKHDEKVIRDLEAEDLLIRNPRLYVRDKVKFVDRHRSDLIRKITLVDPVLCDFLEQGLLTPEQYKDVMKKTTSQEKIEDLCDISSLWEDAQKYKAYTILREHNEKIFISLEAKDMMSRNPWLYARDLVNFIDRHKSYLTIWIPDLDPVLCDLREQGLLTPEQYKDVMKKTTSQERLKDLCDIIRCWDDTWKYKAYTVIKNHNEEVMKNLEEMDRLDRDFFLYARGSDHFVDRHRYHLICNIKEVDPVLDDLQSNHLLTGKQCEDLRAMTAAEQKMSHLCDLFYHWPNTIKDQFYISLWRYNYGVINNLERSDREPKFARSLPAIREGGALFIDRYKQHLIERIRNIRPVIHDLHSKYLLTEEEHDHILRESDKDMMILLYDIIRYCDDDEKEEVFKTFYEHNPKVIDELKELDKSFTLKQANTSQETEKSRASCETMLVDRMSCKLCGKQVYDSAVLVSPMGNVYRLELRSPGLYRCQKTGIKFWVNSPVVIEYKIDSWSDHLKDIPHDSYEALGPLFNIQKCSDPNAVSAVYLPHFLCLKGFSEDPKVIKCAHFKDGNLTLETPTKIEPFYITLENPTFSCLGPILSIRKRKTPIHGIILIYFRILCRGRPEEEYKIHLYTLPHTINVEENLDKENKKFGFQRIKKHEHTDTVYSKIKYLITGRPGVSADPETLKFDSEPYQFTEIRLKEKKLDITLFVSEEKAGDMVWKAHLTQIDLKDITDLLSRVTVHEVAGVGPLPEHFVDRHRQSLIERTSYISPVLDSLLSQRLLTQEQYDTVRSKKPNQEAMRKLFEYMTIWGQHDKEKLYQALKTYDAPLIIDLEQRETIQL